MGSDWLQVLDAACKAKGQNTVAKDLGVSPSTISLVRSGNYKADTKRIEQKVRGALMNEKHDCPVLGVIDRKRCVELQRKPLSVQNHVRMTVWKACQSCKHNVTTREGAK